MISQEREQIVSLARGQIGVKWRHQGRVPGKNLDCGGLLVYIGKEMGLVDQNWDMIRYGRYPEGDSLAQALAPWTTKKSWVDWKPGDIALLTEVDHRWPLHLGILSEQGGLPYMIHAWAALPCRRVVETIFDLSWQSKLCAVFKYSGVPD